MKVLGIVPARAGSKRLPRKNLLPLGGKPLVAWAIEAAMGADALLAKGDLEGQRVWLRILTAVDALRFDQPCGPVH